MELLIAGLGKAFSEPGESHLPCRDRKLTGQLDPSPRRHPAQGFDLLSFSVRVSVRQPRRHRVYSTIAGDLTGRVQRSPRSSGRIDSRLAGRITSPQMRRTGTAPPFLTCGGSGRDAARWCLCCFVLLVTLGFAIRQMPELLQLADDASNSGEIVECISFEAPDFCARFDGDRARQTVDDSGPPLSRLAAFTLSLPLRLASGASLLQFISLRRK
jgi:hypothetical protein